MCKTHSHINAWAICSVLTAAQPTERKPGGGKQTPAGSNPDLNAAEQNITGAEHGKQGSLSCRAKAVHVSCENKEVTGIRAVTPIPAFLKKVSVKYSI